MIAHEEEALRRQVVSRAVANLRARNVIPAPAVLALYARYMRGELSRLEVQVEMCQRAEAMLLIIKRLAEKNQAYEFGQ